MLSWNCELQEMDGALNQKYQIFENFIIRFQLQGGLELQNWLSKNFLPSLEEFNRKWRQCDSMTRLNNYGGLIHKINEIQQDRNKWFYIGYTNRLCDYLWTTEPKSAGAGETIRNQQLDKKHTYYTQLADVAGQNENNLISMFFQNGAIDDDRRCLNKQPYGKQYTKGIVYCLVYEPRQP